MAPEIFLARLDAGAVRSLSQFASTGLLCDHARTSSLSEAILLLADALNCCISNAQKLGGHSASGCSSTRTSPLEAWGPTTEFSFREVVISENFLLSSNCLSILRPLSLRLSLSLLSVTPIGPAI